MWIYIFRLNKSEDTHENKALLKMVILKQKSEKFPGVCTWKRPGSKCALYLTIMGCAF